MKLDVKSFGLTCGLFWGIGLFFLTWWLIAFDGSSQGPTFIGRIYRGYSITPVGSVIGLIWAFVDGHIGGVIFSWLYKRLSVPAASENAT